MSTYNNSNGYNYSYTYSNGNYTSQVNVVNGVMYQKNITSMGNGCGGDNECNDGYSLYFPCTKNITRGQNVCFEFFIGDNANNDELDMRDLEALTLDLSGRYGCPYKSYTYPEDIVSLQTEYFRKILYDEFSDEYTKTHLVSLKVFDEKIDKIKGNVIGEIGEFYTGDHVKLIADDTPTHIFIGWGKENNVILDGECNEFTLDDLIVSRNKVYEFDVYEDVELYAIYKERKKYTIRINFENRHSHFQIIKGEDIHYMTDKERDTIDILEGYHFVAICMPYNSTLFDDGDIYTFDSWSD